MNYASLSAAIQQELQNYETSFVSAIPQFVQLAEENIYRSVQIPVARRNQTGNITSGNMYLTLPTDFLSCYWIAVIDTDGNYNYLLNKEPSFIREAYPNPSTQGLPVYYSMFDQDTLSMAPSPDGNYVTELSYYYMPQSIVTAGTTWLGTNGENALFYGSCMHAAVNEKADQDMITYYKAAYDEGVKELTILCEGRERKDTYREMNKRLSV